MELSQLFAYGSQKDAKADVLLHHTHGAMDAGNACSLAVHQMRSATIIGRVATFNRDELTDYRASRPQAVIQGKTLREIDTRSLVLDLATDLDGRQFLLLHGPEPDFRWEAVSEAVIALAKKAGVKQAISLLSVPSTLPHTRPMLVQQIDTDLQGVVPGHEVEGISSFPSSLSLFLQGRMAQGGLDARGILVSVPYYLVESDYYPGAAHLLQGLKEMANLSLPVGDLTAASYVMKDDISEALEANPEMQDLVRSLEDRFDNNEDELPENLKLVEQSAPLTIPTEEEIDRSLENFFASHEQRQRREEQADPQEPLGPRRLRARARRQAARKAKENAQRHRLGGKITNPSTLNNQERLDNPSTLEADSQTSPRAIAEKFELENPAASIPTESANEQPKVNPPRIIEVVADDETASEVVAQAKSEDSKLDNSSDKNSQNIDAASERATESGTAKDRESNDAQSDAGSLEDSSATDSKKTEGDEN
ncbi:hypothetical protein BK816_05730 [Boudabousia tangfeifanii]|uniref:PAC2 family protein n=1 Tax=Boudabousia tangfeifanii TaxID=1912795 RepID=A0A1D9MKN6_9ACTO|nr:PAC2 family protein [Boudabousia tangfeifanii]AOZ72855.1 hypothetical protein BK816_05730 [Boudabousia tangfeifanii]